MQHLRPFGNRELLAALVLVILLQPVVPGAWMLFLYLSAMAFAVWMLEGTTAAMRVALTLLVIPCLILLSLSGSPGREAAPGRWSYFELTVAVAIALFLLYACYVLLHALLRARTVTTETILGAINLYIVFGLMWSLLYAIQEWALPGSFRFSAEIDIQAATGSSGPSLATFTYYSFVTQATQGYGDIFPVHPFARSIVVLHTIAGQFYLAVVIAYFLGLYIARDGSRSTE